MNKKPTLEEVISHLEGVAMSSKPDDYYKVKEAINLLKNLAPVSIGSQSIKLDPSNWDEVEKGVWVSKEDTEDFKKVI